MNSLLVDVLRLIVDYYQFLFPFRAINLLTCAGFLDLMLARGPVLDLIIIFFFFSWP